MVLSHALGHCVDESLATMYPLCCNLDDGATVGSAQTVEQAKFQVRPRWRRSLGIAVDPGRGERGQHAFVA